MWFCLTCFILHILANAQHGPYMLPLNLRSVQVDNMFAPNPWESYCSALSGNINCIGLLVCLPPRPALSGSHEA